MGLIMGFRLLIFVRLKNCLFNFVGSLKILNVNWKWLGLIRHRLLMQVCQIRLGSSGGSDKQLDNKQYEGGGMVTEKDDAVGEIEGGGFGIGMVFISCNGV